MPTKKIVTITTTIYTITTTAATTTTSTTNVAVTTTAHANTGHLREEKAADLLWETKFVIRVIILCVLGSVRF